MFESAESGDKVTLTKSEWFRVLRYVGDQAQVIDWMHHYIADKQYDFIPPAKDFELRDVFKKIEELRT